MEHLKRVKHFEMPLGHSEILRIHAYNVYFNIVAKCNNVDCTEIDYMKDCPKVNCKNNPEILKVNR